MGLSCPLLLPLKTHWHFRKCHRFTSFSEDHFSWWCSWVIRQHPPRAPQHSGRENGWRGQKQSGTEWYKEEERGFKETGDSVENIIEYQYNKLTWPSRVKPLSWQRGVGIWRVAIHTADLFTALYSCLFRFPKHQKHPSASHSPSRPFDLGLHSFHKVHE